jgi:hypothetical protein
MPVPSGTLTRRQMCRAKTSHRRFLMTLPIYLITGHPVREMAEAAAVLIDRKFGIPLVDQFMKARSNVG